MAGLSRMEMGQQSLVRKDGLPGWLDEPGRRGAEILSESVAEGPFPGIELEQARDRRMDAIDETSVLVTSDVGEVEEAGREPRLARAIFEIRHRPPVLGRVGIGGEGERPVTAKRAEPGDQLLV